MAYKMMLTNVTTLEAMMSVPQSTNSDASVQRCGWEPPALTELRIGTETKSNRDGARAAGSIEPALPAVPTTKLGFSIEASFPLASRT
jgi:hypothetical protein